MIRQSSIKALLFALSLLAAPASAQQQEARSDGKAFGESLRSEAQAASKAQPTASELPNYDREAVRNLERLADNPDQIEGAATAASRNHQGHRLVRDSMANRARFESDDIEAVIARSLAINTAPLDYTSGMSISGNLNRRSGRSFTDRADATVSEMALNPTQVHENRDSARPYSP